MIIHSFRRAAPRLAVAVCLIVLAPAVALAQFYKGREIQILISHPAGGGYDAYARLFARHLSRFLDGNPATVAQNMPGAAGIVMANAMGAQQRNDGTLIALGPGSLALADMFGAAGARYDAGRLSWIGSMNADVAVALSWHAAPFARASDLLERELIVGGAGATDQSVVFPTALNRVLGTKFRIIPGYAGSADLTLALERGEIAGIGGMNYSSILANKPDWLKKQLVNILVQLSLERRSDLPGTPTVLELAASDDQRRVLELVFSQTEMSRVLFAPPGVPDSRLGELRAAFDAMTRDREFLDEATRVGVEINRPMSGRAVDALVRKLRSTSPALARVAADAVRMTP